MLDTDVSNLRVVYSAYDYNVGDKVISRNSHMPATVVQKAPTSITVEWDFHPGSYRTYSPYTSRQFGGWPYIAEDTEIQKRLNDETVLVKSSDYTKVQWPFGAHNLQNRANSDRAATYYVVRPEAVKAMGEFKPLEKVEPVVETAVKAKVESNLHKARRVLNEAISFDSNEETDEVLLYLLTNGFTFQN